MRFPNRGPGCKGQLPPQLSSPLARSLNVSRPEKPCNRSSCFGLSAALVACWLTALTFAQGGLYGPDAPMDVAYLRVVNATADIFTPQLDGNPWQELEYGEVSEYVQVPPGLHLLTLPSGELEFEAGPESFTTVVAVAGDPLVVEDTPLRDISRGLLTVYNLLGEHELDLTTADGTEVIAGVEPRGAGSVVISEAEVGLAIVAAGETLASLESRLYRRGVAHSLFVLPSDSQPLIVYAEAGAEE